MCEIFALNARTPVQANDRLREFYAHSVTNPHGWGLAWHDHAEVHLHKEGLRAIDSAYLAHLLEDPIHAYQLIAHIREATIGNVRRENCHPFRGNAGGRDWIIAHNGTIIDDHLLGIHDQRAAGDTDSEQLVLHLLDALERAATRRGGPLDFAARFDVLTHEMEALSAGNKLNLVLDDGDYLYVHTNTIRDTLYCAHLPDAALFCTVPLDDGEDWRPVPHCQLIAYRHGQRARTAPAHAFDFDDEGYLERYGIRPVELAAQEGESCKKGVPLFA